MQVQVDYNGEHHTIYGDCDGGDFTIEEVHWRGIDITDVVFDDQKSFSALATLAAKAVAENKSEKP